MIPKHLSTLAAHVACMLAWTLPIGAEVTLVKDGAEPLPIYHPAQAQPLEKTAAAELAKYLERLSGTRFGVLPAPEPLPEKGIFVGAFTPAAGGDPGPDGFRIRAGNQRVELTGGSPHGTLCAVFAMLEEQFGCRWWSQDEESLPPVRSTLALPDLDAVTRPAFAIHNVWNREAQSPVNQFAAKARTTSAEAFTGGHTMYPLLTPYAKDHPEIYPQDKEGTRKANNLHFCYLAPGIAEALAEALEKQIAATKRDPARTIFFAGMGDWYGGMCECADCKRVYEEETWTDPDGRKKPGYTATLLRMINRTAELLEKKHPGVRIGTFAYMSLEAPPAKTKPRENVSIRVPRLRHCTVHGVRECEKNATFARNLERWCEIAPGRVFVWEYGANYKNFINPFPCLASMADNLKFYHQLGIRGVEIQGNYVSPGGDLAVLKNYVWRRIFWQPELDPQAVVSEFCHGYYGPAAADVLAYVDALEKSVREPSRTCADEFAGFNYLTPEIRARMAAHRDAALAKAAGDAVITRRVREATVGLDSVELWAPAPFEERDGRLIRTDLGRETFPRAQEMLEYVRQASPTEWSSGRAAHMGFLAWQGGPLVTLSNPDLTVKVAPLLNGQIRQIAFRGKPLLHVENNAKLKGFPFLGGSLDATGTRHMMLDGEPTARTVRVTGEGGVSLFGGATRQLVQRTFTVGEQNTLAVVNTVRRPAPGAAPETRNSTVTTVYAAGKRLADVRVETQAAADRWEPLTVAEEQAEVPLPAGVRALRVHLPAQECVVLDRYLGAEIESGKILLDRKGGTLSTVITTKAVDVPKDGDRVFLERQMEFAASGTSGR